MQSRFKLALSLIVILAVATNGLACQGKGSNEDADHLLAAGNFQQAADAYRKQLDSDLTGKAHVGLILSLLATRNQQVKDEVRSLTKVTCNRWPEDPIVLSCAAYVAYQESREDVVFISSSASSLTFEEELRKALQLFPTKRADNYSFAAMGLAQASLKGNASIPKSHLILALVNAQLDFRQESRDHLKCAVDLAFQLSEAEKSKEKEEEVLSALTASLDKDYFSLVETDYSEFLKSIGVPELDYPNIDCGETGFK